MTRWPLPSPSPNTIVTTPDGGKLAPWGPPIKAFVGRTLDSSGLGDQVGGVHAFRARIIRYYPALNRVIQIQGPRIASYIASSLFARLGSPMTPSQAGDCLAPDFSFRYPDSAGGDVRDVLYDFDVDDRGYVAGAFDPYGSVLLDPSLNVVFRFTEGASVLAATKITAGRVGGSYFVSVYPQLSEPRIYDTTEPSHPMLSGVTPPPPRVRPRESSAGGWSLTFGPDAEIGGYGNVKLFKSGVRVPCKVPGTDLEYFAAAYNSQYARGGGFVGPTFTGITGGEDMTDVQLFALPNGRVLLVVAASGLCDWYELEASGVIDPEQPSPPATNPPVVPPTQPPTTSPGTAPFDLGAVQAQLHAATQAITLAQAILTGATFPPVQPPVAQPPAQPPVVQPPVQPPPIVPPPPQPPPSHDDLIGKPCNRAGVNGVPLPEGYACQGGKVVKL
jgi:hypothetical protein